MFLGFDTWKLGFQRLDGRLEWPFTNSVLLILWFATLYQRYATIFNQHTKNSGTNARRLLNRDDPWHGRCGMQSESGLHRTKIIRELRAILKLSILSFLFADHPGVGPTVFCVSAACQSRAGRWHSCLLRAAKRS